MREDRMQEMCMQTRVRECMSEYVHWGSDRHERVQPRDIFVVHAHTTVTDRLANAAFFIGAVQQVAVAHLEFVRAEHFGDAPLARIHGRNEDLAVEYNFDAGRKRPEVAETV